MNCRLRLLSLGLCILAQPLQAMDLGTNFWNIKWHGRDDCFKDFKAVSGDDVWNPRFLEELKPYQSLRFMDWDATNKSPRSKWSERNPKASLDQSVVAYEWMIDLCNRTKSDMWLCIPHRSIDRTQGDQPTDYALRLAILIKTGIDMGDVDLAPLMERLVGMTADDLVKAGGVRTSVPLDAGLRVYFEYSNETWNGSFTQTHYAAEEGTALGLNPHPKPDAGGKDWTAGFRYHAWAAIRIFRAVDLVFGSDSPRVVKVLAGWTSNSFVSAQHVEVLKDAKFNPWGVKANAIASAPYFGHKVDGGSADAAAELRKAIIRSSEQSAKLKAIANSAGLKLVAYEGGQHVAKNADKINRDPVMFDLYQEYLAEMSKYFDHFSHYCHVGTAGSRGAWGAAEKTGQEIQEAHKYRALVEFAKKNPRVPLVTK